MNSCVTLACSKREADAPVGLARPAPCSQRRRAGKVPAAGPDMQMLPDAAEVDLLGTTDQVAAPALRTQPRPMNGIFVAMMVMNWTLASSGRLAM